MSIPLNFSLVLTSIRLIGSLAVLPVLIVYVLPLHQPLATLGTTIVYIGLALTDFFDGYLARRYKQTTVLGALLDPLADKFLLYTTLIALLVLGKIFFYWVILFIGREFFVMGLRLVALEKNVLIRVSNTAKIKTAVQLLFLGVVLIHSLYMSSMLQVLQDMLLVVSLVLTLVTAGEYTYYFIKKVL